MAGDTHTYILFDGEIPNIHDIHKKMGIISGLNSIIIEIISPTEIRFKLNDFNGLVCEECKGDFHLTLRENEWEFWGYTQHRRYLEELFFFVIEKKGAKLRTASGEIYRLGVSPLLGEKWNSDSKGWRWMHGHPQYYKMSYFRKLLPW